MSSLLILNYFTFFPSFPIVDFKQVNIYWKNYLTFYLFDICFNVSTEGRQDLIGSNVGNSVIFYFTHSVRCNHSKPLITHIIHLSKQGKVCINATTKFWGHKNKAGEIVMNSLP